MQFLRRSGLLAVFLMLLAACSGGGQSGPISEVLALTAGRSTFIFFYTDN